MEINGQTYCKTGYQTQAQNSNRKEVANKPLDDKQRTKRDWNQHAKVTWFN